MARPDRDNSLQPRLYIDMDGVLVDFDSGVKGLSQEILETYASCLDEVPSIFSRMNPMPGALEAIDELYDLFDIYILSTAPWSNPSAWADKLNWVKRHLGDRFRKRLILCHHKDFLKGDFLVDDREKNGAKEFSGEWIHFGSHVFPDWDAVVHYLKKV